MQKIIRVFWARIFLASVFIISGCSTNIEVKPPSVPADGSESINQYVLGLKYDPDSLLAVQGDGTTILKNTKVKSSPPDRTEGNNEVITCNRVTMDAERNFGEVAIFQPTQGVIWSGALIKADHHLADGEPIPITSLQRAPVKLNIDLPGIGTKGNFVVQNPDYGNVRAAIDEALEWWNNNAYKEGYVNSARSTYSYSTSYSTEQLAISLGFNVKWLSGNVSGQFSYASDSKNYVSVAMYKQVFYTVSFALPSTPASVLDTSVTLPQVQAVVTAEAPPAYVAEVDYGRFVMFRMNTSSSETSVDAKAALEYGIAGTTGSGNLETKYKSILSNSEITVTTLGGNADSASQIVSARGPGDLARYLKGENAVYSKSNPGEPIAYRVNFLKDHQLAKMGSTTQYVETNCKIQKNGFISFLNGGGYVARFTVTWSEQGKQQEWIEDGITLGYTKTRQFPGDATNFTLKAIAYTGLVGQNENEIFNFTSAAIPDTCYKVWGTTLDTAWGYCQ